MSEKNFVVSFNANDDNVNSVLSGYNRQIMDIMMLVNNCIIIIIAIIYQHNYGHNDVGK